MVLLVLDIVSLTLLFLAALSSIYAIRDIWMKWAPEGAEVLPFGD